MNRSIMNSATIDEETSGDAPFTPSELAAPSPPLHRLVNARMETLLRKHEPVVFPNWTAKMIR